MADEYRDLQRILTNLGETRLTRRSLLKYAAAGGVLAGLGPLAAACGGSSPTSSPAAGSGKKGGILKIGVPGGSAKDTLDGQAATTTPQICATFQLYDTLMGWNSEYQLEPRLAKEYSVSKDAKVWTVKLRDDVVFHNGKKMTADDVVASYKRIITEKKSGAGGLGILPVNGVRKVDATTVAFHLSTSSSVFSDQFASYFNCIMPVDVDVKNGIGTGPFKLKTFKPGRQMVFAPNPEYWDQQAQVDELQVLMLDDDVARVNALLGGQVQAITELPSAQIEVLKGRPGMTPLIAKTGAWQPITMRIDQKPFTDVKVRQAFRLIADRKKMIDQAYAGYGDLGNDMYAPFDPGYPKDLPQRQQDLEQAKSLLKQAGQENLTVTLTTSDDIGSGAVAAAQVFAEQAKGAGVNVQVKKLSSGVFYDDQYLKWTFAQDFWYTRNYLAQTAQGTTPDAAFNETHWKNDKWLALIKEAVKTVDQAKRNELVGEAQEIEYEEGGLLIWSFKNQIDAYSSTIGGLTPDKSGAPLSGFRMNKVFFV